MPNQTTFAAHSSDMRIADGCKVWIMGPSDVAYTDFGITKGSVKIVFKHKEFQLQSGNAGKGNKYSKEQEVDVTANMQSKNYGLLYKAAGGLMTESATAASENSSIPDQTIAAGWDDNIRYELIAYTSATDTTKLKLPTKPVLTSVIVDPTPGSNETLTEWGSGAGGDYTVVEDDGFISGWAIIFNSAGMVVGTPKTKTILINWGANTPTARTHYYMGTTIKEQLPIKMKFEHTDSAGLVRGVEIYKMYIDASTIDATFKGQDEEGYEELPFKATGVIDTSLTDNRQLLDMYIDTGAV